MSSFVGRSRAVVIASHSRKLVEAVCNKVLVLQHGRVAYLGPLDGAPAELPA
jgi:ABC-type polysaccharide/polyol phosphate transport system ATPase subunit